MRFHESLGFCLPLCLVLLLVAEPGAVNAQAGCGVAHPSTDTTADVEGRFHPAPLDRPITLALVEVPLRTALERLQDGTSLRLSYSTDLIPADRAVCLTIDSVPLGEVFALLLRGTGVEPKVIAPDHVLLVPVPAPRPIATATNGEPVPPIALDPVRVHASRVPDGSRRVSGATVITGDQLMARPASSLLSTLADLVPGLWVWEGAGSTGGGYLGSMRGAASFMGGSPKVLVDGIELANPLSLARISPETVDYIEVITGPHGAAQYGANAMGGVVHVHTRKSPIADEEGRIRLRGQVGLDGNRLAPSFAREQGMGIDVGDERAWGRVDVAGTPQGETREWGSGRFSAEVAGRLVGEWSLVTVSGRYHADEPATDAGWTRPASAWGLRPPEGTSTRDLTAGLTVTIQPHGRWTHSLVMGADVFQAERAADSPEGSGAPFMAVSRSERATIRLSSEARFDVGPTSDATLGLVAEHSIAREQSGVREAFTGAMGRTALGGLAPTAGDSLEPWRDRSTPANLTTTSNMGLGLHTTLTVRQHLSVNGGLRLDRIRIPTDEAPWVPQPSIGVAWSTNVGAVGVTARGGYGRAIRWRENAVPKEGVVGPAGAQASYWVERQSGIEAGVDLRLGEWLGVHVTRFDQTASGLGQPVTIRENTGLPSVPAPSRVGAIGNQGWEVQASLRHGPFSGTGTLSAIQSRVLRTASGYDGELRPGDRMLGVPAHILGLTGGWTASRWATQLTVSRAGHWIGYDYAALSGLAGSGETIPRGPALRGFWREYDGITLVGASAHRTLRHGLDLSVGAENLLNAGADDPYGPTSVALRAMTIGLRLRF